MNGSGERALPRVLFAGTPDFAATALRAILGAAFPVVGVLTQPDRPSGRGQKMLASPVKRLALENGLDLLQPPGLRDAAVQASLGALDADVIVVAAYGLILPPPVLALPRLGCLNIHASLLPRWRGAAPIQRAIEAGDAETGVCIMRMEAGLDTGPVCLRVATPIGAHETAGSLHDRLALIGADAIVTALRRLSQQGLSFEAQPPDGVNYANKLAKAESAIDWRRAAGDIDRQLRAFDPVPGSTAVLEREPTVTMRLFTPRVVEIGSDALPCATVIEAGGNGVLIACAAGSAIRIQEWQRPGGRRLGAREFLAGFPISPGDRFVRI